MSKLPYTHLYADDDTFRLLELSPGSPEDQIRVKLIVTRLSKQPHYEAFSYVWGSLEDRQVILVNDCEMQITLNLFRFLKAMRNSASPRVLFVDAICINQMDYEEKSFQVQMMGKIYQSAARVISWLGPGTPETDALFEATKRISIEDYDIDKKEWKKTAFSADELLSLRDILHEFMLREYWKRAWIVQECLLAKNISFRAGDSEVEWEEFRAVHMMLLNKDPNIKGYTWGFVNDFMTRFDHLASEKSQIDKEYPVPLSRLIKSFNTVECTDPRDKIFAFFYLIRESREGYPGRLFVDYNMSTTSLYFRACFAYLNDWDTARPHRVLPVLKKMFGITSEELLDALFELVDPMDLKSPTEWLVGAEQDAKGRKLRTERTEGFPYMESHFADFKTIVEALDARGM